MCVITVTEQLKVNLATNIAVSKDARHMMEQNVMEVIVKETQYMLEVEIIKRNGI